LELKVEGGEDCDQCLMPGKSEILNNALEGALRVEWFSRG
jgi:hypothetical protein